MTDKEMSEYVTLMDKIHVYNFLYHTCDVSAISDEEFDVMYKRVVEIEKDYPSEVVNTSPTRYVGSPDIALVNPYLLEDLCPDV